jgi:hypothetical protein
MLSSMSWMRSKRERITIQKTRVASASTCFRISGWSPLCGEIDRDVKALLEQSLGRHQVQGVEAPAGESVPADSPYAALAGGSARTE